MFYQIINFGLSNDQKNLLSFLVAFFYLKGSNSLEEYEWKLFVEGTVSSESLPFTSENYKNLFRDFKQLLDNLNFLIADYVAPFKSYTSNSLENENVKMTRSIERHEFPTFTKPNDLVGKRQPLKKLQTYSKRTSTFLMNIAKEKEIKSPKKPEKPFESTLLKKMVSFEVDESPKGSSPRIYSSIYKNRLSSLIKNDFLLKINKLSIDEKSDENSGNLKLDEIGTEQEVFVVESPRKKNNEGFGKLSELSERPEIMHDRYSFIQPEESEEEDSDIEEEDNNYKNENENEIKKEEKIKLYHSKTEKRAFLFSNLLEDEKQSKTPRPTLQRKNTFGSPKHIRIKPKKNTPFTTEMNLLFQKEPWIHTTGLFFFITKFHFYNRDRLIK